MVVVCLYARVSTDKQTTDNQVIRLKEYSAMRGYTVVREYTDIRSGKDANRPELKEMLNDAKKGKFEKIIAIKLDRLGRSVMDLRAILETVDGYGVKVEFVDQQIDTSTAMGRMVFTVLSGVAEFERDLIVERTCDGLNRARKEGVTLGRPKSTLSAYQLEKARTLLSENPSISMRELSSHFVGISRPTLIKGLRDAGILSGKNTGGKGVYKETIEKTVGKLISDTLPQKDNKNCKNSAGGDE